MGEIADYYIEQIIDTMPERIFDWQDALSREAERFIRTKLFREVKKTYLRGISNETKDQSHHETM